MNDLEPLIPTTIQDTEAFFFAHCKGESRWTETVTGGLSTLNYTNFPRKLWKVALIIYTLLMSVVLLLLLVLFIVVIWVIKTTKEEEEARKGKSAKNVNGNKSQSKGKQEMDKKRGKNDYKFLDWRISVWIVLRKVVSEFIEEQKRRLL